MKQIEHPIQAIRDWSKNLVGNSIQKLERELDPDSLLRKTGDASKTTVSFTPASTRSLPITGDNMEIILGKILKYLTDLKSGAFNPTASSGTYYYTSLYNIPIRNRGYFSHDSYDAAYDIPLSSLGIPTTDASHEKAYLIYGSGSSSSATATGADDFFRVTALMYKQYSSSSNSGENWIQLALGSSGSTARWSLSLTAGTSSAGPSGYLRIPKGAAARIHVLELPLNRTYA